MAVKRTIRPELPVILRHLYENIRRGVEQVTFHAPQSTQIVLCAGGPSLAAHREDIHRLQLQGAEVVAVGNAAHAVNAMGIKVNGHIVLDGAGRNRDFVITDPSTRYFVASQCDPKVFDALEHHRHVYIWHVGTSPEEREVLLRHYGPGGFIIVGGGSFVGLRAITLLQVLGYSYMHIFGFDSCRLDEAHHAYPQKNADRHKPLEVTVGGRKFQADAWMLDQATQFCEYAARGYFADANLAIHGDGLIAHMVRSQSQPTWSLE